MTPDPARPDQTTPLPPEQQEEFVRLLNGAHAMLLRYVLSLVANRHDAEDVLQRASVVMWKRFGTFESGTDFVAWATTIAFYEVKNFQRVTGRSRLDFDDDLMQTLAAERAQHVLRWSPRMEALEVCVEKLDPAQRKLVEKIYTQGIAVGEVARQQGRAPRRSTTNSTSSAARSLSAWNVGWPEPHHEQSHSSRLASTVQRRAEWHADRRRAATTRGPAQVQSRGAPTVVPLPRQRVRAV
ncbi:MAG: sigma-70 family RNA polymerase sigma factor [Verrucomicrobia bacterium]|nr:sigma-70 family RNA polymerase sigma factor [Verrucomicrobiota bacterium]